MSKVPAGSSKEMDFRIDLTIRDDALRHYKEAAGENPQVFFFDLLGLGTGNFGVDIKKTELLARRGKHGKQ